MSAIKTIDLTHIYGNGTPYEKKAIDNVNIEIDYGELVGVIGHTGSGKSTLIQHFNGLLKPTSGSVYICDRDIWDKDINIKDVRFKVGLVFQYPEYQLFEDTVYDDIAYGPKNMGLTELEIDERVKEAASFVGIDSSLFRTSPFDLSGGQKRRVAIAGVIAMRPEILILDEPAAGLDPIGRESIFSQIKNYHAKTGCTVLIVSHSMEDIARYTDKVLVMANSSIIMYDSVENVFSKSDYLKTLGLNVPQISNVFNALVCKGVNVNSNVYTVDDAEKEIIKLLREKEEFNC